MLASRHLRYHRGILVIYVAFVLGIQFRLAALKRWERFFVVSFWSTPFNEIATIPRIATLFSQ